MAVPRKGFLSASGCHAPTDATKQQEGRWHATKLTAGPCAISRPVPIGQGASEEAPGVAGGPGGGWGVKRRGYSPWAKAAASARLRCTEPGPLATRKFCGLAQRAGRDACGRLV